MLRHGLRGVPCHIAPFDPAFRKIVFVKIVRAGCSHADELQIFGIRDRLSVDQYFVHDQDISVCDPCRRFFRRSEGISDDLPELFEL